MTVDKPVDNSVDNPVENPVDKYTELARRVEKLEELARELQLLSNNKKEEFKKEILSFQNKEIDSNCNCNLFVSKLKLTNKCRTPEKRGATSDPRIKIFLSWYKSRYEEIFGRPVILGWARDSKLVKTALKEFSLEELKDMADTFFGLDDEFYRVTGKGVNIFFSKLNALSSRRDEGTGWEFLDAK